MKKKYKFSNFAFYTFIISISIAAATLTIFGYSSLLSGYKITGSFGFWVIAWVCTMLTFGFTAFLYLIYFIFLLFYDKMKQRKFEEQGNTSNTGNKDSVQQYE